jgi:hypothetical protein
MYLISNWFNILNGTSTNHEFFHLINSGWLEMKFIEKYGDNPSEEVYLEWMYEHAETIYISQQDYDYLTRDDVLSE